MLNPETEIAYQNGAFIPDAEAYPPRWASKALDVRLKLEAAGHARIDLPYGVGARQRYDLFLPEATPAGLMVFVHGGYWQSFSKSDWSHLASGGLARGWAVAMTSNTLCPEATVAAITSEVARAISAAAGEVAGPIALAGHSAGGHLVARMLCGDVELPGSVASRIRRVMPISGVFDLRPLRTTSINDALGLSEEMAVAESPYLQVPHRRAEVLAWVGAEERPALLEQTLKFAQVWGTELQVEPGRHHFDVIEGLEDPGSAMLNWLLAAD